MGLIDPARVRDSVDIVEVIGAVVQLKKRGRSWWGSCPFHGEKSASFHVRPNERDFKCFGCGEHGDVIRFVQKTQGCSFREACDYLGFEGEREVRYADPMDDPVLRDIAYGKTAVAYRVYREDLAEEEDRIRREEEFRRKNPQAAAKGRSLAEELEREHAALVAAEKARYWPREDGTTEVNGRQVPRFHPGEGQNVLGAAETLGFKLMGWKEKGEACAVIVTSTGVELPCRLPVLPSELRGR